MSEHSNVVAADLPEPYSAEVGLQRHIEQAHAISSLLSEAGVGPCSLPEGVRLLMNDRDRLADALAALREQRCETCQHNDYGDCALTLHVEVSDLGCRFESWTSCERFGNGCRAWARREP